MGKLMEKKLWRVTAGGNVGAPTDPLETADWELNRDAASGLIWGALEPSMKELVKAQLGTPNAMWTTLRGHHQQKKPTNRFVAYESLLGIQKQDVESLPALCMRIQAAQNAMKDTRPDQFTIDQLDSDLACMALIRALPAAEYGSFRSLLLLQSEVTLSSLMESCRLEELNRSSTGSSATAFAASSSSNMLDAVTGVG